MRMQLSPRSTQRNSLNWILFVEARICEPPSPPNTQGEHKSLGSCFFRKENAILLQDDPNFSIELEFKDILLGDLKGLKFDDLSMDTSSVNISQATSYGTGPSSGHAAGGFDVMTSPVIQDGRNPRVSDINDGRDLIGLEENPSFGFDEEGGWREFTPQLPGPLPVEGDGFGAPVPNSIARNHRVLSSSRLGSEDRAARVQQEHEEARQGHDLSELRDDTFPATPGDTLAGPMDIDSEFIPPEHLDEDQEQNDDQVLPRTRKKKHDDEQTKVPNSKLRSWHAYYLENMDQAMHGKQYRKRYYGVKRNCCELMMGSGVNGVFSNPKFEVMYSATAIIDMIDRVGGAKKRKQAQGDKYDDGLRKEGRHPGSGDDGGDDIGMGVAEMERGREAPPTVPHGDPQGDPMSVAGLGIGFAPVIASSVPRGSSVGLMRPPGVVDTSPLAAKGAGRISRQSSLVPGEDFGVQNGASDLSFDQFEFFGAGKFINYPQIFCKTVSNC
jgi:hypothetical protein